MSTHEQLREACARKLGRTKEAAELLARQNGIDVYYCPVCDFYHLATPPEHKPTAPRR